MAKISILKSHLILICHPPNQEGTAAKCCLKAPEEEEEMRKATASVADAIKTSVDVVVVVR